MSARSQQQQQQPRTKPPALALLLLGRGLRVDEDALGRAQDVNQRELRLRQLLIDLRKHWDVVVVDTPPVLVVNDALVIARAVDGIAVVVESGATSRKLVADMRGQCQGAGIEPVGVVVNKMDFFTTGYGAYMRAYRAYVQAAVDDESTPDVQDDVEGGVA